MANRLAFTIVVTVLGTSTLLGACGDDEDHIDGMNGGEAGSDAGTSSGGSSSGSGGKGGSSAGKAGSVNGAGEMQGGQAGAAGDTGVGGEGGQMTVGGAPVGGVGGATDGGASGMGGAGGADDPAVTYACGTATLLHKLCSAFSVAECDSLPACTGDPPPDPCCSTNCASESCPQCVAGYTAEREFFAECPACLAELDRYFLCGVEPYEAGNLSEAVSCLDTEGPVVNFSCEPILFSAFECQEYLVENPCPDSWPVVE
jgi:hypothetical protein